MTSAFRIVISGHLPNQQSAFILARAMAEDGVKFMGRHAPEILRIDQALAALAQLDEQAHGLTLEPLAADAPEALGRTMAACRQTGLPHLILRHPSDGADNGAVGYESWRPGPSNLPPFTATDEPAMIEIAPIREMLRTAHPHKAVALLDLATRAVQRPPAVPPFTLVPGLQAPLRALSETMLARITEARRQLDNYLLGLPASMAPADTDFVGWTVSDDGLRWTMMLPTTTYSVRFADGSSQVVDATADLSDPECPSP